MIVEGVQNNKANVSMQDLQTVEQSKRKMDDESSSGEK